MMVFGCSVWKVKVLLFILLFGKYYEWWRILFYDDFGGVVYKFLFFNYVVSV